MKPYLRLLSDAYHPKTFKRRVWNLVILLTMILIIGVGMALITKYGF